MGRPLRFYKTDAIYFITGRCLQARLLLRPSKHTNNIIAGVLAKALDRFADIELYAFVFVSNHFHMLLSSQKGHIAKFMQYLRSNIAKKIGQQIDWTGKFWDRRYDAEPVLDDEALKGRLRYILAHGVKEGLVKKCRQWPGFSSYPELVEGSKRSFAWPKLSLSNVANKKKRPKKQAINIEQDIEYPIRITLLPCYKDKPQEQQIMVRDLVAQIENEHMLQRKDKSFLGIAKVLSQHPHDKPHNIKRSVRPLCHASSVKAVETYKAEYEAFAIIYAEASKQYREQIKTKAIVSLQNFPQNSYPPPINWGKRAEQQTTV